ncbi:NADH-ubiquinone oxidoreductase [Histoplasma capsulatum var. duboisii H88]|uniref:NADH-ubiquinone oxidoreductase n=1 Tax=Ajellomyces capsulatus (strain H88) TaxID=544711 RepID=F0UGZ1_AJEC8|nr:NADH-ubiquinone oxidoreductase [Histoplasma capsulatum var. duboisii H88]
MKQVDIVRLLTVGSKAASKTDVLQIGDVGAQQLVEVKQKGEEYGLAVFFKKEKKVQSLLDSQGLPPMALNLNLALRYELGSEHGYPSILNSCISHVSTKVTLYQLQDISPSERLAGIDIIAISSGHRGEPNRSTWLQFSPEVRL